MTKLYVANATPQTFVMTFWVPGAKQATPQTIEIGGQLLILGKDLPREVVDHIIEQNRRYGLCTVAEAERDPNFSGIAYSIDKPVSLTMLYTLVHRRRSILAADGTRMRQEAAVATNDAIDRTIEQEQLPAKLKQLEMSLQEVTRDSRDESPEVAEGVRVSRQFQPEQSSRARRSRARR